MNRFLLCLAISVAVTACGKENSAETEGVSTEVAVESSGNRFYDAAVSKVSMGVPGATAENAKCIVDHMTADGAIGVGEINQMSIGAGADDNAGRLNDALSAAMEACVD